APRASALEVTAPHQVLQVDAAAWSPRNDLARDLPDFTGRQEDLGRLLAAGAQGAGVHAVTGPGGVGHTALAVRAAQRLAGRYPDGQLSIDVYGYSPDQEPLRPEAALGALLRATGGPPEAVPDSLEERSALWRARLAGRRVLVVLDNAA